VLQDLPKLKIDYLEPRLPIIQGGMAVKISMAPLAAAVANEGGVGVIGASGMRPSELIKEIELARKLSDGVIGVNIMVALRNFADLVKAAIESKVDFITSGAGFSRDVFRWCKEAKMPFVPVVSSKKAAYLSEKFGAAAVVVEGKEAGGHLGTDRPLMSILREVVDAVKIPVIAAGGIIKGSDMKKVFAEGASGVQMGTRFALSKECSGHDLWKKTLLYAEPGDIELVTSPVGLPFRAVRTDFVRNVAENGQEDDIDEICRGCLRDCSKCYCIIRALELAQQGDLKNGLFTTGERVIEINDILPVKDIINNLLEDFKKDKMDSSKVKK